MKISYCIPFLILFSFVLKSEELPIFEKCIESKETMERLKIDDLIWRTPEPSDVAFPVKNIWGKQMPIITPEKTIVSNWSTTSLVLGGYTEQILQVLENNTYLSLPIREDTNLLAVMNISSFNALTESFSIKIEQLNCEVFKKQNVEPFEFEKNIRLMTLLLIKSTFKPSKATGVYKTPLGFVITTNSFFIYHTSQGGVSTSSFMSSPNNKDVFSFINTLNKASNSTYHNEILDKFINVWESEKPDDWAKLQRSLKKSGASFQTIEALDEAIEHLQAH